MLLLFGGSVLLSCAGRGSGAGFVLREGSSAGSAAKVQARPLISRFQTLLFIAESPVGIVGWRNADRVAGDCSCKCRASKRFAACGFLHCWRSDTVIPADSGMWCGACWDVDGAVA